MIAVGNSVALLADVLMLLRQAGAPCHVFGGWAEELLGLVPARGHGDIDLLHCAEKFDRVDDFLRRLPPGVREIRLKRFHHKRAFLLDGVCCEIVLVRNERAPVTWFWGDVPYRWEQPLLHPVLIERDGHHFSVVSSANLSAYRARRKHTQPQRWIDAESIVDS